VIRVAAGPEAGIATGRVRVVHLPRATNGTPREALLLRDQAGTLRAYLNRCEHLPVPLDAGGRKFLSSDGAYLQCQTHGARYRLVDGYCVVGPCAGRALEALTIEIDDTDVYIVIDG
jgi:nitrite reductase/ring-hydroxylating ferredoxin subunit